MKNIIFFVLVCSTANVSFAQKFEIGLNGGIGYNTAPSVSDAYPLAIGTAKPLPVSGTAMMKVAYNTRKWKFGIEADYLKLSFNFALRKYYIIDSQLVQYAGEKVTATLGKPAIPLKLIADRKITFKKMECYAGVSVGYVMLNNSFIPQAEFSQFLPPTHGTGYSAGLQVGGTYFISKHIGVNAEVSGDYMHLNIGSAIFKLVSFPATVGIRYRFL